MALNATIFRAALQVSDIDRSYYGEHALVIARHPSETDERMMVRLLAYALHASATLTFGRGLSTEDEPDVWQKDLTGLVEAWIDVGQPDDKRIRRSCGRAGQVFVYSYGIQGARVWWDQIAGKLEKIRNLTVVRLPPATRELTRLTDRNMRLTCTVQDQHVWLSNDDTSVEIALETL